MPSVQVQAKVSVEDLLKAIGQLSKRDLNRFVDQALILRAQRQAPSLSHEETELLQKINQTIPAQIQQRYNVLIGKRKTETLTEIEHSELLQITDQIESMEAQRIKYLAALAQLRRISLSALMEQLGIRTPEYA